MTQLLLLLFDQNPGISQLNVDSSTFNEDLVNLKLIYMYMCDKNADTHKYFLCYNH